VRSLHIDPFSAGFQARDGEPGNPPAIAGELRTQMPDAGHCPHIEIPDWVARDIAERLAR
jgi:pimeloyl-ACP methyl ester carboxylesterase